LVTDYTKYKGVAYSWNGGPMPFCPIHIKQFTGIVVVPETSYWETITSRSVTSSLEVPPPSVDLSLGRIHGARIGNAISLLQQRFK